MVRVLAVVPWIIFFGKERNREQAKTLRGDPERVKTLIDTCDFARTYTSGVLSFEEKDLPDVDKQQLMDELEQTLLPGLDKDQYSILWVEHQDKGRLELNFVIPNIELHSGKRLQPYYDRADRPRVNAWQTLTNDRLGLSDPNDPERRRELTPGRDLPKNSQKAAESITAGLSHLAMQGLVRNRQDVINVLESAGMTIARETKSSISIASPDGGKNLRLKGALYERDFRFSESLRGELEAAGATYRDARESRISEAERCYQRGIELKREEYQQRYPRRDPTTPTALENHLPAGNEMAVDWPVIHRPDLRRTDRGTYWYLNQQLEEIQTNEQSLAVLNSKTGKGIVVQKGTGKYQGQYYIILPKRASNIQTYPYQKQTVVNYSVK